MLTIVNVQFLWHASCCIHVPPAIVKVPWFRSNKKSRKLLASEHKQHTKKNQKGLTQCIKARSGCEGRASTLLQTRVLKHDRFRIGYTMITMTMIYFSHLQPGFPLLVSGRCHQKLLQIHTVQILETNLYLTSCKLAVICSDHIDGEVEDLKRSRNMWNMWNFGKTLGKGMERDRILMALLCQDAKLWASPFLSHGGHPPTSRHSEPQKGNIRNIIVAYGKRNRKLLCVLNNAKQSSICLEMIQQSLQWSTICLEFEISANTYDINLQALHAIGPFIETKLKQSHKTNHARCVGHPGNRVGLWCLTSCMLDSWTPAAVLEGKILEGINLSYLSPTSKCRSDTKSSWYK